ncbi:MAG: right-handed parallel beta-helix repeat-containing protein [Chitinophagaceae bacterium]|nr:right-handed parallel beta-helix repeat-containing protein [Chitinophagaceae bacterium]
MRIGLLFLIVLGASEAAFPQHNGGRNFYIDTTGNDGADGTKETPWKTLSRLKLLQLKAGDRVLLKGGQVFDGSIQLDSGIHGSAGLPISISSYGSGKALIRSGNRAAIRLYQNRFIRISDLLLEGSGRKNGNTESGLVIAGCRHITVNGVGVRGFQKAGLAAQASSNLRISHVFAADNGYAGISIEGEYGKRDAAHIYVGDCRAENNPGDPSNLTNHSGNGIVAGYCRDLLIEYCAATNNGWDMPRKGNGPVGIWAYESDSVTIRYCISYRNKTSVGGGDGGGFDLDGGITHSVIHHCLSYDNQGSGFGIFQYAGAAPWHDNEISYNISENDGAVSPAGAGVFIWNNSRDPLQLRDLDFHHNIIYNEKAAAISYETESEHSGFRFHDNNFIASRQLILGRDIVGRDVFLNNNWWSLSDGFNIDGIKNLGSWSAQTGKEQVNGKLAGTNNRPMFVNAGHTLLTDPRSLDRFFNYRTAKKQDLRNKVH